LGGKEVVEITKEVDSYKADSLLYTYMGIVFAILNPRIKRWRFF